MERSISILLNTETETFFSAALQKTTVRNIDSHLYWSHSLFSTISQHHVTWFNFLNYAHDFAACGLWIFQTWLNFTSQTLNSQSIFLTMLVFTLPALHFDLGSQDEATQPKNHVVQSYWCFFSSPAKKSY